MNLNQMRTQYSGWTWEDNFNYICKILPTYWCWIDILATMWTHTEIPPYQTTSNVSQWYHSIIWTHIESPTSAYLHRNTVWYSREHVILGPTHLPSPTHMARKNPSRLNPVVQVYVSWVPRGKNFWLVGASWDAWSTIGGSLHLPANQCCYNVVQFFKSMLLQCRTVL